MKKSWFVLALLPFVLSGCLVLSLHPLFTEGDPTFDPALIGTWLDADGQGYAFEKIGNTPAYQITAVNSREGKPLPPAQARLMKLGNAYFLDIYSPSGTRCEEMSIAVPVHLILRVDRSGNSLSLKDINWTWLTAQINAKRLRADHELLTELKPGSAQPPILLTGPTASLQKLLGKISAERKAFSLYKLLARKGTVYPAAVPVLTLVPAVPAATTLTAR